MTHSTENPNADSRDASDSLARDADAKAERVTPSLGGQGGGGLYCVGVAFGSYDADASGGLTSMSLGPTDPRNSRPRFQ